MAIKRDYKDDILASSMGGKRQYNLIENQNGTVSFEDVTEYEQEGDICSAGDLNQIGENIFENLVGINRTDDKIRDSFYRKGQVLTLDVLRSDFKDVFQYMNLEYFGIHFGDVFTAGTNSGLEYIIGDIGTYAGRSKSSIGMGVGIGMTILVRVVESAYETYKTKWNTTGTTYDQSALHSYLTNTILPVVRSDFDAIWGSGKAELLSHSMLCYDSQGVERWTDNVYIQALSEVQVMGYPRLSMDKYQQGDGERQLALFREINYTGILDSFPDDGYWLRSLASANEAIVLKGSTSDSGVPTTLSISSNYGVPLGMVMLGTIWS